MGDALIALSFVGHAHVVRENSFAASTIQVTEGQPVVSTGPYRIVRHPMYASVLLLVIGIPLSLDSSYGLSLIVLLMEVLLD
jgi:protein-S-isoprenylcysteine O-methyltransferase Ste14